MKLTEISYDNQSQPPIDSYGPNFFRVMGELHEGNLLILPSGLSKWRGFNDLDLIISAVAEYDVIFIGMGGDIANIPPQTRAALDAKEIPFEVMSSPSASRTYNVLLSEGRRVAAALIAVD